MTLKLKDLFNEQKTKLSPIPQKYKDKWNYDKAEGLEDDNGEMCKYCDYFDEKEKTCCAFKQCYSTQWNYYCDYFDPNIKKLEKDKKNYN